MPRLQIPVRVRAAGSPLLIQKERTLLRGWHANSEPRLSLAFGQLPVGMPLERTFHVFNNSGMDMDVEWALSWVPIARVVQRPITPYSDGRSRTPGSRPLTSGDAIESLPSTRPATAEQPAAAAPGEDHLVLDGGEGAEGAEGGEGGDAAGAEAAPEPELVVDNEIIEYVVPDEPVPFTVEPQRLTVRGNGVAKLTVRFVSNDVGRDFDVFLTGRQTVHQASPELPRLQLQLFGSQRPSGPLELVVSKLFHPFAGVPPMAMPPLQVNLTAETVTARLELDTEAISWHCSSCHNPYEHDSFVRTVTLTNLQAAPLAFVLVAEGPFQLLAATPSVVQDLSAWRGTTTCLPPSLGGGAGGGTLFLPPQECVDVTLRFTPPFTPDESAAACEQAGRLLVCFTHGETQAVALHGHVDPPVVAASRASLEFGRVHPKAPKPLEVTLLNTAGVEATWAVVPPGKTARQALDAARSGKAEKQLRVGPYLVTPAHGVLAGRGLGMPRKEALTVIFAPSDNLPHSQALVVAVYKGNGCVVELHGTGSYDEADEFQAHLLRGV